VEIGGLYMLARTIDKMRAQLPGGDPGAYRIPGFSERLLNLLGIAEDDLQAVVAHATSDDEVAVWVRSHSDPSTYREINDTLSKRRIGDRTEAEMEAFVKRYPIAARLPRETLLFDLLDQDDRQAFAPIP
jgi:hypothetical protein